MKTIFPPFTLLIFTFALLISPGCTDEDWTETRKAQVWKMRNIIMNDDGQPLGDVVLQCPNAGPMTRENFLNTRLSDLKDSPIDAIFYDWHPNCGWTDFPDYSPADIERLSRQSNNGQLVIDPQKAFEFWEKGLQMVIDYGHSCGKEVFYSLRMNDTHDMAKRNEYLLSNWKRANLDKLVGKPYVHPPYGEGRWSALDFDQPAVRDRMYEIIEFVCEKNPDLDGIELDFLRHPHFFKPQMVGQPVTQEQCNLMTGLIRRIRKLTTQIEKKRHRPFLVAVRIPESIGYSKEIGLDVEQWLKEGLVDMVIAGGYMIFEPWKNLVEFCHKYDVPFYACISASRLAGFGPYTQKHAEDEALYAWNQGVDGIYTFNLFHTKHYCYRRNLGDVKKLRRMNLAKDYKPILIGQSGWDRMLKDGSRFLHIVDISGKPYFTDKTIITLKSRVPQYVIHYTLDGSTPTEESPTYTKPFTVDRTAKLRVKAFSRDGRRETFESEMDLYHCDTIYRPNAGVPFEIYKCSVGTARDLPLTVQNIPIKGTAMLFVRAGDIDAVEEIDISLNGHSIPLPKSIMDDIEVKSACIPFDKTWLNEGKNQLRVVFKSTLNGQTSGFVIADLAVLFVSPSK